jgi:hypothetical protein
MIKRGKQESLMFLDGDIENHNELCLNVLQACKTYTDELKQLVPAHAVLDIVRYATPQSSPNWRSLKGGPEKNPR